VNDPEHGRQTEPPGGPGEQPRTRSGENLPGAEQVPSGGPGSFPCPRCERINSLDSDYCSACGMPLEDARTHAQAGAVPGAFDVNQPAGFLVRLAAFIGDLLIIGFIIGIGVEVMWGWDTYSDEEAALRQTGLLMRLAYPAVLVAIWRTTVGKRLFGLYVVRSDGSRVGPGRALARSLAALFSDLILGIGYLMVLFREDNRGLHDLICDTVVVRRRKQ